MALYHNLGNNASYASEVHEAVKESAAYKWRGHRGKENKIRKALSSALQDEDQEKLEELFEMIKAREEY